VRRLPRDEQVIASAPRPADFAPLRTHRLVVERQAGTLRVLLDGSPALTLNSPRAGRNQAAGIAFKVGNKPLSRLPQRVRNLSIEAL
jgi:hypothetical protein